MHNAYANDSKIGAHATDTKISLLAGCDQMIAFVKMPNLYFLSQILTLMTKQINILQNKFFDMRLYLWLFECLIYISEVTL